ncbi:MAG: peptidase U32 family protein, partial [Elusimicrobiota bacterium]|nr:peptidase U32 family protein [Elusimicrobiota bacterium]
MNKKITIPELVAPAGNLEKLKVAFSYGADAAYLGGRRFGLRAAADNFTDEEIVEAVDFAHKKGKKIYVTLNTVPHNRDMEKIKDYLAFLKGAGPDALIISDPGVLSLVKEAAPSLSCTLSTQANNVNYRSALFWHDAGIKRIVAARDISIDEVRETVSKISDDLEIEIFVHGAMCISYSGRCLLSSYMTGREANTGECTQPCRWKYRLVEEKRPGEYFPVIEEDGMTTIMSSKDLCLIEHIPEIVKSGVSAVKIEGRMKSSYYAA